MVSPKILDNVRMTIDNVPRTSIIPIYLFHTSCTMGE
jgi:hypothetical protein